MISVTIAREGTDLVIDSNPYLGDFHIPEEGFEWPRFGMRREYAPPSVWVAGELLLSVVSGPADWQFEVYAHGDTSGDLSDAMDELEAALTQFAFDVTIDVNGVTRTYAADPEFPDWGEVDTGMARAHMAKATIRLQLNPPEASP